MRRAPPSAMTAPALRPRSSRLASPPPRLAGPRPSRVLLSGLRSDAPTAVEPVPSMSSSAVPPLAVEGKRDIVRGETPGTPIARAGPRAAGVGCGGEGDRDLTSIDRDQVIRCWQEKRSLRGAILSGLDLSGLDLRGMNFESADLSGANLEGSDLTEGSLIGANLRGTRLGRAKLCRTNLELADLRSADLTHADLRSVSLCYGSRNTNF